MSTFSQQEQETERHRLLVGPCRLHKHVTRLLQCYKGKHHKKWLVFFQDQSAPTKHLETAEILLSEMHQPVSFPSAMADVKPVTCTMVPRCLQGKAKTLSNS